MLEIIDNIDKSMLRENCVLVSFDVVNVFPNIYNRCGLLGVKGALPYRNFDVDSTQWIVDALEICPTCNNSKFNHQHFPQIDVQHSVLICFVTMLTMPWPSMTLLAIISILSLVFGKNLEMIFVYYGNMVTLPSFPF